MTVSDAAGNVVEIILTVYKFSVYAIGYNYQPASPPGPSLPSVRPTPDPDPEVAPAPDPDPYYLVTEDHFAYIIGYPDGTVRPQGMITREEAATIFFRLLKDDVRAANMTAQNSFTDVLESRWSNRAISTMAKLGIVLGYEDGSFRPGSYITRAEFVTMVARFLDISDISVITDIMAFNDIADGHWATSFIKNASYTGVVLGYPDGSFQPEAQISRAEAVAIVNRLLGRRVESISDMLSGMVAWSDNADPDAWYYYDIQEATNSHEYRRKDDGIYEQWIGLRPNKDWSSIENP